MKMLLFFTLLTTSSCSLRRTHSNDALIKEFIDHVVAFEIQYTITMNQIGDNLMREETILDSMLRCRESMLYDSTARRIPFIKKGFEFTRLRKMTDSLFDELIKIKLLLYTIEIPTQISEQQQLGLEILKLKSLVGLDKQYQGALPIYYFIHGTYVEKWFMLIKK